MAKNNRGKGLKSLVNKGRGVCPNCNREGVKIVFETKVDDKTVKLCKVCHKTIANKA
ncbi:MAG: hypothetical protein RBS16_07285 [Candidatus Cloacimonadales bacterium]|jgi:RNA polymerase subunit RPABC4/transcription elongation factor Spt4|nr:hypothetical protein [Candidatus Cloacimonadota bacterium]MDD2649814.1 hypothetical protein [Candidatus Cloacimonadota bacterium]MDD3501852.1 hypothetical protein [Candidatus Cloacimonadota bacterium]MDX9977817.1 hypothetical protein [Candidatus Cloacimonadales bacterium]